MRVYRFIVEKEKGEVTVVQIYDVIVRQGSIVKKSP